LKDTLIAFLAGSLLAGGTLGTLGYLKINDLSSENTRLEVKVKKLNWRQENLNKNQASLTEELNGLKEKKDQGYDQTIGALIQAKDNASIDALYEIGLKALQEKDYPRAYFALAQVEKANPKFKEIPKYYPEAKKAYDKHQQSQLEEKIKTTYSQAYDQQAHGQLAQAQTNYQRVLRLRPTHKEAQNRLRSVNQYLALGQRTRDFAQKKQWLEATYKLGVSEQAIGRYAQAREAYYSILNEAATYKDTASRFKVVNARLPKMTPQAQAVSGTNCYEKGVAFGKCAKLGANSQNCASVSSPPAECKANPEFVRGMQTALNRSGTSPGAGGNEELPTGEGANDESGEEDNTAQLIKEFPDFLKGL
jgi:outer membrane murein-binding lipoprotein Lpp